MTELLLPAPAAAVHGLGSPRPVELGRARVTGVRRPLAAYGCATLATGLPWPLLLVLVWDRYADGPQGAWAVGLAGAARMARPTSRSPGRSARSASTADGTGCSGPPWC